MGTRSKRAGPHTRARALERSPGLRNASAQPEKCQDGEDDYDEADEIDDIVHTPPFRVGSRSESRTPRFTHDQCLLHPSSACRSLC
jgi:hypothetical protein